MNLKVKSILFFLIYQISKNELIFYLLPNKTKMEGLSSIFSGKTVAIKTSDGFELSVPFEIAKMSETIKNVIEDAGEEHPIDLITVNKKAAERFVKYYEYHLTHPYPEGYRDKLRMDQVIDFDKELCDIPHNELFELTIASDYLGAEDLKILACITIANKIKEIGQPNLPGDPVQRIRDYLGIENDFTPDEEERLRKENKWVFLNYLAEEEDNQDTEEKNEEKITEVENYDEEF